jgi:hypothetical protein
MRETTKNKIEQKKRKYVYRSKSRENISLSWAKQDTANSYKIDFLPSRIINPIDYGLVGSLSVYLSMMDFRFCFSRCQTNLEQKLCGLEAKPVGQ